MNLDHRLFSREFEVVQADSRDLCEAAYRLRWQVYCEERQFLDPANYAGPREADDYDKYSLHCLVRHRRSGIFVGVTRLVLAQEGVRRRTLPIEAHCGLDAGGSRHWLSGLPRHLFGEISRFCVSREFLRCALEHGTDADSLARLSVAERARRHAPMITLALIAASSHLCEEQGVEYCYAAMEPHLIRLLKRLGLNFRPLGPAVDYFGMRVPSYFRVREMAAVPHCSPARFGLASPDLEESQFAASDLV